MAARGHQQHGRFFVLTLPASSSNGLEKLRSARIKQKKRSSLLARGLSFGLFLLGVAAPLVAAAPSNPEVKLAWTQVAVAALALAGLVQLGDKIFGWSSGWLRYITTATAMERLTLQFELDWAASLIAHAGGLGPTDVRALSDLAKQLLLELDKRRAEETESWVAEFNAGMAALNEMVKFQKDATEKAAVTARAALQTTEGQRLTGAIDVTIARGPGVTKPVTIQLDDGEPRQAFSGHSWAARGVATGIHLVRVSSGDGTTKVEAERVVQVRPGEVAAIEVKLP